MGAARIRYGFRYHEDALMQDIPEVPEELLPYLEKALDRIKARRDEAMDPKQKRLAGSFSAAFPADLDEDEEAGSGRVVYLVEGKDIVVIALHKDHDEAYRRARVRYKPVSK